MDILGRMKTWLSTFRPKGLNAFIDGCAGRCGVRDAVFNILLLSALFSMVILIILVAFLILSSSIADLPYTILLFILFFVILSIYSLFTFFFSHAVIWLVARHFSGISRFNEQVGIDSFPHSGVTLLSLFFLPVLFIPCVGHIVQFALTIYSLSLRYIVIQKLYGLSKGKAILAVLSPILGTVILIVALLFVLFVFAFLSNF